MRVQCGTAIQSGGGDGVGSRLEGGREREEVRVRGMGAPPLGSIVVNIVFDVFFPRSPASWQEEAGKPTKPASGGDTARMDRGNGGNLGGSIVSLVHLLLEELSHNGDGGLQVRLVERVPDVPPQRPELPPFLPAAVRPFVRPCGRGTDRESRRQGEGNRKGCFRRYTSRARAVIRSAGADNLGAGSRYRC